jgi:hypothetical protein
MWQYARREPFTFAFGLLIAIGSLWGLYHWGGDLVFYDAQPRRLGVDAAVAAAARHRQWVAVEAAWDCAELRTGGVHSWVPVRTRDGQLVVAHFQRPIDCGALNESPVDGILEPMWQQDIRNLQERGLARADTHVWELAVVDFEPRQNAL